MDPITQGALGASAAGAGRRGSGAKLGAVAALGAIGGMAPDLDVLIRSAEDPLLFLDYHRQFTHALVFIPVGALLCALVSWPIARRWLSFRGTWGACLLGYGTHGLLDACTSYGTQLLWPFSDARVAWNNVSVIDPLVTLPLLALVFLAVRRRSRLFAVLGLAWTIGYLLLGVVQYQRALAAAERIASARGHLTPARVTAKPSFANLLLWKTIYRAEDRFWVDAVRTGGEVRWQAGSSVPVLDAGRDLPWLASTGTQGEDLRRFRHFSADYVALDPAHDHRVMDIRYSMLPQEIRPLWGIAFQPGAPADAHVHYVTDRETARSSAAQLWQMLRNPAFGEPLPDPP